MTITLNADYDVTLSTALLGYVGETNARPVSVEGLTVDGADRYVLTIDYGDGTVYEVDITGGTWTPTADILRSAQTVSCQIAAKKLAGDEYILVKKSRIFRLRIGTAIGDNAIPSPDVAMDALDRIDAIGRQAHADMQTAVTAADTATTAANNATKSATSAGLSADTAEQAAERAETAKTAAETSATQADTARQGAETARAEAVTSQNNAKISAAQAATSAQQTEADKTITAGYAKTAKTCADSTTADKQAVQTLAEQVTADKANVAENATKVAEDRTAAETAAQTAQSIADSLPDDYVTAVGKIAENTAEIANLKLTDKELQRRVNALYDIGNGITHKFETDSDTAYAKTVPTGGKLMSVKNIGGRSIVFNQLVDFSKSKEITANGVTFTFLGDGIVALNGTCTKEGQAIAVATPANVKGHKYLLRANPLSGVYGVKQLLFSSQGYGDDQTGHGAIIVNGSSNAKWYYTLYLYNGVTYDNVKLQPQIFNLTAMFGSGNEPSTVEEFEAMFPNEYYPYNVGEIISAGVESVVEQGRNLWNIDGYTASDLVDLKTGYWGVKLNVKPNSTYCISVTRDTALSGIYGKLMGADKRNIGFFGHTTTSAINAYTGHPITFQTANENYVYVAINSFKGFYAWKSDFLKYFPNFQIEKSSTATAYAPYHSNEYPIPEAIRALPGYGVEGNVTDFEAKTYTQNNAVDGAEVKALDTPIVTDISNLIPDDFLRNIEVEAGGSITFKNSNGDSYRIPVPNEEEYVVKLSEIGGSV
ncbi:hypothetical protein [uncultured Ruminococcus sp.]|uniref:hypothetical protein n=1 Tax=uncultured Ruminococcus sp. TaxID=165186 RepID=UPI002593F34F|nr:hypothetical protein [uncultured Ruminococcus sp.]